jgi:hypothetical protein
MTHRQILEKFENTRKDIDQVMDNMADRASSIGADFALTLHFGADFANVQKDFNHRQQASRILQIGLNNMGKKLYGKGGVLKRSVFIERANGVGLHAHIIFANESAFSDDEVRSRLYEGWEKTRGAHKGPDMFHLARIHNLSGWSDYICKSMRHENWECWDVANSNI